MAMPHVGIDISANQIRFVELVRKPTGLALGKYGTQEIPTPVSFNEPLTLNKDLIAALKKVQRTNKFQFVEVSIPEEKSYLFTTEVPSGDPEVIRSHIEFHLEENVPISLADAVFDYHIIHRDNKKGVDYASVSVVPQQVIDQYIDVLEMAGMTPVSFLIENQALTKAIIPENDVYTYLVVHIGDKKTVLSIVSEGAVQFTSTVNVGGDDFTNAIAKEYSLSFLEAERMKVEKGFTRTTENTTFFMLLINSVSALRDEIQKAYMYWLSHIEKNGKDASQPLRVILAGKDASIIGFRDYMSLSLKVPVELANVWVNVLSFDKEIPPIEYLESLDYATVIGLALPKNSR
jgi:type IV pilus assembly protein PilM